MKKKVLALVCAMTLVFGGALNVCAAGSVTTDDVNQAVDDVKNELPSGTDLKVEADGSIKVDVSNVGVSVNVSASTSQVEAAQAALDKSVEGVPADLKVQPLSSEQAKAPLAKIAAKLANVVANKVDLADNCKVTSVSTAFVADISASTKGKVALKVDTLNNSGSGAKIDTAKWQAGSIRVYALHALQDGSVEIIHCQLQNGAVVFSLNSYSPVAIIVETLDVQPVGDDSDDNNSGSGSNAGAGSNNNGAAVSPKTADVSTAAAVVVIAMMSVAGLVVLKRRVRA